MKENDTLWAAPQDESYPQYFSPGDWMGDSEYQTLQSHAAASGAAMVPTTTMGHTPAANLHKSYWL